MAIVLLALLIILILFGLGFALHVLWWIALIALVLWLLGFVLRVGESAGRSSLALLVPLVSRVARGARAGGRGYRRAMRVTRSHGRAST